MKKVYYLLLTLLAGFVLGSCNQDPLGEESIITVDMMDKTPFDDWLEVNYALPYNIRFKYRYEEILADYNYYTVPADYEASIKIAHLLKYVCIDAYDEVAGIDITRKHFPKQIVCTGEWLYRNNGTIVLGTAEGGRQINLMGLNHLEDNISNAASLNQYYMKTIHHEFTHILNQNIEYTTTIQYITGNQYVGGTWNEDPYGNEDYYLAHGFISDSAQQEHTEDFAEMMALYVTNSPEQWEEWMTKASEYTATYNEEHGTNLEDGAVLIQSKLDIVKEYMQISWHIDLDALRKTIQRRQQDVFNGTIDLLDLTVNQ